MSKQLTGIRRSEEELQELSKQANATGYRLQADQSEFTGTPEQLEMMQTYERQYLDGSQTISDEEWEIYKRKFNYKESLTAKSPNDRDWFRMQAPLGSLAKVGSFDELKDWIENHPSDEFSVAPKLDGLTANVIYQLEGNVYRQTIISSRGNGVSGLILYKNALSGVNINIPSEITLENMQEVFEKLDSKYENASEMPKVIELRGEAVIPKNKETYDIYGEFPVWRNIAAGIFNRKMPSNIAGLTIMHDNGDLNDLQYQKALWSLTDSPYTWRQVKEVSAENGMVKVQFKDFEETYKVHEEYMDVVFYSIAFEGSNIDTEYLSLLKGIKYLDSINQESGKQEYPSRIVTKDVQEIIEYVAKFYGTDLNGKRDFNLQRERNRFEYAMDGVVIKPTHSDKNTQLMTPKLGRNGKYVTPHYPSDQVAIKLESERVKVKLDHFEYRETSLGNHTVSGILEEPVMSESGSMVSNINLHNPVWLEKNDWIKEGHEYWMIMSLDIIPVLLNPELID